MAKLCKPESVSCRDGKTTQISSDGDLKVLASFYSRLQSPLEIRVESDVGPLNQTILVKGVWHPLIANCPVMKNTLDGALGPCAPPTILSDR